MSDDISIRDANGIARPVATDEIGGRSYQIVKPAFGADGSATLVSSAAPLPVDIPSFSLDAFGRLRISSPQTIFDSKQVLNNQSITFTTSVSGSGTIGAWSQARASTTISVGATAGTAVRQTRRRFNYQPAKSQLIFVTFVSGNASGVVKRIGQFDDANGLFLQIDGAACSFVVRSSVSGSMVDLPVAQASWNVDTLPELDITKSQILVVDYEWLGVGRVRFGFVIDGVIRWCHFANHANNLASVYMSTPNLPIRYEVSAAGATAAGDALECICCSVSSEGGVDPTGFSAAASNAAAKTINTVFVPLVQIRLKAAAFGATVLAESVQAYATSVNDDIEYGMFWNPVLSALTGQAWGSAANVSSVEVDTGSTGTIASSELRISAGFGRTTSGVPLAANSLLALGARLPSTPDVLCLAARSLSGPADIRGALSWVER